MSGERLTVAGLIKALQSLPDQGAMVAVQDREESDMYPGAIGDVKSGTIHQIRADWHSEGYTKRDDGNTSVALITSYCTPGDE